MSRRTCGIAAIAADAACRYRARGFPNLSKGHSARHPGHHASRGELDGTVTIALTAEGRLQVEAAWNAGGSSRSAVRAIDGHFTARTLASEWADALAAGREPVSV